MWLSDPLFGTTITEVKIIEPRPQSGDPMVIHGYPIPLDNLLLLWDPYEVADRQRMLHHYNPPSVLGIWEMDPETIGNL